jgi:hypothetical protein
MKSKDWAKNRAMLKGISNPASAAYEVKMRIPELTFEGVRGGADAFKDWVGQSDEW